MWPEKVLVQFQVIPPNASENDFFGPLFPHDSDFTVAPRVLPHPRAMARSIFLLEVRLQNKPVLIVHLKLPSQLGLLIRRQEADEQLRSRMDDLCGQCPPLGHHD